ncbi:MAG: hypothetical protein WCB68_06765 [Pyrinomonadaceae bacterium]
MPTKYSPDAVLADSDRIARVWTENTTFTLGEITLPSMQGNMTGLRQKRERIEQLRMEMTALNNQVIEETAELANINTRALSGIRAVFGPDSSQYEQAGGTRTSERKRPASKKSKPTS